MNLYCITECNDYCSGLVTRADEEFLDEVFCLHFSLENFDSLQKKV